MTGHHSDLDTAVVADGQHGGQKENRCQSDRILIYYTREGGPGTTSPVGQYSPDGDSPHGVADMAGNVWEWCANWFQSYEGNRFPDDAYGETYKVLRGGSWFLDRVLARCAFRHWNSPDNWFVDVGFRCARGSP
jgi:formylglycine-generating enzyme required for sulfatase activity